jgi:transglutaminase-like putative cysteine protease
LSEGIHHGFRYRRREAKGIQLPIETLRLGHGSCRDFAMLMIDAARSFGLAARFASGYLAVPLLDDPQEPTSGSGRGSTHAWAQIYLPGAGWIDFDPTSGSVGNTGLVTVAVVPDPRHAIPLHGTFFGFPSDQLGMEVQVSVMSGAPNAILAKDGAETEDPQGRNRRNLSYQPGPGLGGARARARRARRGRAQTLDL